MRSPTLFGRLTSSTLAVSVTLLGCGVSDVEHSTVSYAGASTGSAGRGADGEAGAGSTIPAPTGGMGGVLSDAAGNDAGAAGTAGLNAAGAYSAGASSAGSNTAGSSSAGSASAAPFPQYQPVPSGHFEEEPLFQGTPPNFKQDATPESIGDGGRIYDVSVPTLRRYPMDLAKATGIGFVVFPGGGYTHLDIERHATALAKRMGPQGIAVFGLKYRVGKGTNDARRDALLDANRAIRLVRQHAAEWGVHTEGVGVVSYSAGSHLAMNLAGHFDLGQTSGDDPVEAKSSRPAFFASMCTWDSGNSSSKFTFLKSTPPVYLCHAKDDTTAPIALAYAVEKQLQALNVIEHLEVYSTGGHDSFNVGELAEGHDWPDRFMTWVNTNLAVH